MLFEEAIKRHIIDPDEDFAFEGVIQDIIEESLYEKVKKHTNFFLFSQLNEFLNVEKNFF